MKALLALLASLALVAPTAVAITPEDVLTIREPRDLQLSPDGKWVAFVIVEPGETQRTSIWFVPAAGDAPPKPIASASNSDYDPRWSPDSTTLAFLSDREGSTQLLIQGINAATSRRLAGGVEQFAWSTDGKQIAYVVRDPEVPADPLVLDRTDRFTRLWTIDVASGAATRVPHPDFEISELAWSPDGNELALMITPTARPDDSMDISVIVVNRTTGKVARTLSTHAAFPGGLRWSPDGKLLTFYDRVPSEPFATWISVVPAAGGEVRPILKDYLATVLRVAWVSGDRFVAQAIEGTGHVLLSVDAKTGKRRELRRIVASQWDASLSTNGESIAYLAQDPRSPADVWIAREGSAPRRLTDLNPHTRDWTLGTVSEVTWKNTKDGLLRRGVLLTPPGYDKTKRYPTVVMAHPGDTSWWLGWLAKWWSWGQLLASNGFVVFMPNYRGVNGEGPAMHATIGDWGVAFQDLEDGVDALIARGIADPDRLGIGGWSNGGFMTAFSITRTTRYKAAVAQAAHTDFFSLYGTSYLRTGLHATLGGSPYVDRAPYDARSPITLIRNCKTPTLILHGINDAGVPIGQAYELYTGLKTFNVPAEMVVYPREGHSIREYGHRLDVQRRVLGWFTRYLKAPAR